ncbi:MAG: hypothetical protein ACOZIN_08765 [Myxococcota bacterium]
MAVLALSGCGRTRTLSYGDPKVELTPDELDLGTTLPGKKLVGELLLQNTSRRDVTGISFSIEAERAGQFVVEGVPTSLGWGKSVALEVSYLGEMPPRSDEARLTITSNALVVSARLFGRTLDPCEVALCDPAPDVCHSRGRCEEGRCVHDVLVGKSCDDQDRCTVSDVCGLDGVCRGSQVECAGPPSPTCLDADTLSTWESPGTCTQGGCTYGRVLTKCPFGCRSGACFDPCAQVTCNSPPSVCHKPTGTCVAQLPLGRCVYELDNGKGCNDGDPCSVQDTCSEGVCRGTPMVCQTPPAPTCLDADNSEVHDPVGVCQAGVCVYAKRSVFCPIACLRGQCMASCTTSFVAGSGVDGYLEGAASNARFSTPYSLTVDASGVIFVNDTGNGRVRQIANGVVSTPPGGSGFSGNHDVVLDGAGGLLVAEIGRVVRVFNGVQTTVAGTGPLSPGFRDGPAAQAQFGQEVSVCGTSSGTVFVADAENQRIRMVQNGQVSTYAGVGFPGQVNGPNALASFNHPHELVFANGVLYVPDTSNHSVRTVSATTTATLAGNGTPGFSNGAPLAARFNNPLDLALDPEGAVYVADSGNHCIRRISPTRVTTFAGTCQFPGYQEGPAFTARFRAPAGIAITSAAELFISDTENNRIRRIDCLP